MLSAVLRSNTAVEVSTEQGQYLRNDKNEGDSG